MRVFAIALIGLAIMDPALLGHSFGPGALRRETFVWDGPHGGFGAVDRLASDVVAKISAVLTPTGTAPI